MKPFALVQKELTIRLQSLLGNVFDKQTAQQAQQIANDFFASYKARRQPIVLDESGIQIVGCELVQNQSILQVNKWVTDFYIGDVYGVMKTEVNPIALGYAARTQLYILPSTVSRPGYLVARHGLADKVTIWTPTKQGRPPENSIFFLALERARFLGHLQSLQVLH